MKPKTIILAVLLLFTLHSPLTAQTDSAYWNQRFFQLLRWTYVDDSLAAIYLPSSKTKTQNSKLTTQNYTPIHWYGYTFQPSDEWPVVFSVALGDGDPQALSLPALNQLAQWGAFLTNEDHRALKEERGKRGEENVVIVADTAPSALHSPLSSFVDSMQAVLVADSIAFANALQQKTIEQTKQRMNREQIFILNINTAHSEYMFGIELNLYNCFDKTISMLEFNVAPYNAKGRVQEDQFHRTVRTMRCMGPIAPGSPAQYTFDELFWDDKDRIKYMRLNSITFHFTDGTSRSFRGYDKILRHTLR